ncbi:MAG TPA: hypothetical protein VF745_12820 [Steroidobacteraceae bacterium]
MDTPSVRVYLDEEREPILEGSLPLDLPLDTSKLADGPHRIVVKARDGSGREGFEQIPFNVHNGPGVVISGLRAHSTRRGTVHLSIDAFSAQDPFNPRYAEARSSIPVWVWVMALFVVAWAVWYAARMWDVPPAYAATPTYAAHPSPAPAEIPPAAAAEH